jgi:hypothetical protein
MENDARVCRSRLFKIRNNPPVILRNLCQKMVRDLDVGGILEGISLILDMYRDVGGIPDDSVRYRPDADTECKLNWAIGEYRSFMTRYAVLQYMSNTTPGVKIDPHMVTCYQHTVQRLFSIALKYAIMQKPYLVNDRNGVVHITGFKVNAIVKSLVEEMADMFKQRSLTPSQ